MGDIDKEAIRARSERASDARNTASLNARHGIGIDASQLSRIDLSARDVPALLDALVAAEDRARKAEEAVQRVEAVLDEREAIVAYAAERHETWLPRTVLIDLVIDALRGSDV